MDRLVINKFQGDKIGTRPCPVCYICGIEGKSIYSMLQDIDFKAPGEWDLKQCPTPDCGLAWLDPMPYEEDFSIAYKNYHSRQNPKKISILFSKMYRYASMGYFSWRYGYAASSWQRLFGLLFYFFPDHGLDIRIMFLKSLPGGLLLDVGCGSGEMLSLLQELGWESQGVEPDAHAVHQCLAKGLHVRRGDLSSQKYPDNYFDVITMHHVIEHVHNPCFILKECFRIMKPHGKLVILTPNVASWGHTFFRRNWRGLEPPRHLYIYSSKALSKVLQEAGFVINFQFTTARAARFIYRSSQTIASGGSSSRSVFSSFCIRPLAEAFFWLEWIRTFKSNVGEEIVLIGKKQ